MKRLQTKPAKTPHESACEFYGVVPGSKKYKNKRVPVCLLAAQIAREFAVAPDVRIDDTFCIVGNPDGSPKDGGGHAQPQIVLMDADTTQPKLQLPESAGAIAIQSSKAGSGGVKKGSIAAPHVSPLRLTPTVDFDPATMSPASYLTTPISDLSHKVCFAGEASSFSCQLEKSLETIWPFLQGLASQFTTTMCSAHGASLSMPEDMCLVFFACGGALTGAIEGKGLPNDVDLDCRVQCPPGADLDAITGALRFWFIDYLRNRELGHGVDCRVVSNANSPDFVLLRIIPTEGQLPLDIRLVTTESGRLYDFVGKSLMGPVAAMRPGPRAGHLEFIPCTHILSPRGEPSPATILELNENRLVHTERPDGLHESMLSGVLRGELDQMLVKAPAVRDSLVRKWLDDKVPQHTRAALFIKHARTHSAPLLPLYAWLTIDEMSLEAEAALLADPICKAVLHTFGWAHRGSTSGSGTVSQPDRVFLRTLLGLGHHGNDFQGYELDRFHTIEQAWDLLDRIYSAIPLDPASPGMRLLLSKTVGGLKHSQQLFALWATIRSRPTAVRQLVQSLDFELAFKMFLDACSEPGQNELAKTLLERWVDLAVGPAKKRTVWSFIAGNPQYFCAAAQSCFDLATLGSELDHFPTSHSILANNLRRTNGDPLSDELRWLVEKAAANCASLDDTIALFQTVQYSTEATALFFRYTTRLLPDPHQVLGLWEHVRSRPMAVTPFLQSLDFKLATQILQDVATVTGQSELAAKLIAIWVNFASSEEEKQQVWDFISSNPDAYAAVFAACDDFESLGLVQTSFEVTNRILAANLGGEASIELNPGSQWLLKKAIANCSSLSETLELFNTVRGKPEAAELFFRNFAGLRGLKIPAAAGELETNIVTLLSRTPLTSHDVLFASKLCPPRWHWKQETPPELLEVLTTAELVAFHTMPEMRTFGQSLYEGSKGRLASDLVAPKKKKKKKKGEGAVSRLAQLLALWMPDGAPMPSLDQVAMSPRWIERGQLEKVTSLGWEAFLADLWFFNNAHPDIWMEKLNEVLAAEPTNDDLASKLLALIALACFRRDQPWPPGQAANSNLCQRHIDAATQILRSHVGGDEGATFLPTLTPVASAGLPQDPALEQAGGAPAHEELLEHEAKAPAVVIPPPPMGFDAELAAFSSDLRFSQSNGDLSVRDFGSISDFEVGDATLLLESPDALPPDLPSDFRFEAALIWGQTLVSGPPPQRSKPKARKSKGKKKGGSKGSTGPARVRDAGTLQFCLKVATECLSQSESDHWSETASIKAYSTLVWPFFSGAMDWAKLEPECRLAVYDLIAVNPARFIRSFCGNRMGISSAVENPRISLKHEQVEEVAKTLSASLPSLLLAQICLSLETKQDTLGHEKLLAEVLQNHNPKLNDQKELFIPVEALGAMSPKERGAIIARHLVVSAGSIPCDHHVSDICAAIQHRFLPEYLQVVSGMWLKSQGSPAMSPMETGVLGKGCALELLKSPHGGGESLPYSG